EAQISAWRSHLYRQKAPFPARGKPGFSLDFPWIFPGFSLDFPWIFQTYAPNVCVNLSGLAAQISNFPHRRISILRRCRPQSLTQEGQSKYRAPRACTIAKQGFQSNPSHRSENKDYSFDVRFLSGFLDFVSCFGRIKTNQPCLVGLGWPVSGSKDFHQEALGGGRKSLEPPQS